LYQVDEEIERRIRVLIHRGELDREEGLCLLDKLIAHGRKTRGGLQPSEQELDRLLIEKGVPTRDDLQKLIRQLDTLAVKIDEMNEKSE
jgi:polyhydroxyalkanoate synthesis regulator phasin